MGNRLLTELTNDNLFDLDTVEGPRLWILPPAAIETITEVFNEDRMAHPCRAHVFVAQAHDPPMEETIGIGYRLAHDHCSQGSLLGQISTQTTNPRNRLTFCLC